MGQGISILHKGDLAAKVHEAQTVLGLAHLRAALRWAVDIGLLPSIPKIQKPRRAKSSNLMKGRPIGQEEFERMLGQVEGVVGIEEAPCWRSYLEGLWWSGLRLAESLELYWDCDSKLCVTFVDDDLMLRIPAELEKGNKDRLLAIAPEFVDFLNRVPAEQRTGRVFTPGAQRARGDQLTEDRVTRIISKIGRAAEVLVDEGRNKFATAHDLRRSFGERWASRVMPQVLMELMRHESIDTTLRYYVGQNAQRTAKVLKEAYQTACERSEAVKKIDLRDTLRDTSAAEGKQDERGDA